jgi:hypothetical protein
MADHEARAQITIQREERKLERKKAKAEASEENMKKTLAAMFKNEAQKKALARDAMAATKDNSRRDEIFDKAGAGAYDNDREVITGEEPRPWED